MIKTFLDATVTVKVERNGTRSLLLSFPDAARMRVAANGSWVLTLPDSTVRRGAELSQELALKAAEAARDRWILDNWSKGTWSKQANRKVWAVTVQ